MVKITLLLLSLAFAFISTGCSNVEPSEKKRERFVVECQDHPTLPTICQIFDRDTRINYIVLFTDGGAVLLRTEGGV